MHYRIGGFILVFVMITTLGYAQVQVFLPDTTANWKSQVTIPLRINNVTPYDIYSYEFVVKYDSLVLRPTNVDHNNTIAAGWSVPVYNDSTKGTLIVGAYGTNKLVGSGRLVNLTFDVVGNPDNISNLTFTYFQFNNGNPSVSTINGRVKIITNLISVTITTNVLDGTEIIVDGETHPAPFTTYWEIGSQHQVSTPSPQTFGSKRYIFQSWSDRGGQTHSVSDTQPTTFEASFAKQYYLSVQSSHGNPQGTGWYNEGSTAYFSVDSSLVEGGDTKYNFISWTGNGTGSYSGAVREASVVVNEPITETASWSTQYYVNIISSQGTPYGTGWYQSGLTVNFGIDSTTITRSNAHYKFISWTGTGIGSYSGTNARPNITVINSVSEQANWDAEYLVVTGSKPDGILQVPGAGWYQHEQQFTTIKAPDSLKLNQVVYGFKGWKVNDIITSGNPITVSIVAPQTIIADFSSDITVVITTSVGQGTKVIVDGEQKDAPFTAQWVTGSRHSIGVVSVQSGLPGIRYLYRQWKQGGTQTQEVMPSTNTTYLAELTTEFYLEVKDEPVGVVNPQGSGWYSATQVVKLDSLQQNKLGDQSSYRFIKWRLDGVDSVKKSLSIQMNKPHSAVAVYQKGYYISGNITFVGAEPITLTLNISGKENFSIQSNQDGSYLIAGLLPGDYVITLTRSGFRIEPTSRSYHISRNEENQYYFAFFETAISPDINLNQIPDHYELSQNYPNPFNDLTTIEYTIKNENQVKLTVYNVLGQVVNQLVDFQQLAGRHQIRWNRLDFQGIRVPPGVYFYRIETGSFVHFKKMIIL
jgi:hypothetical protein